MAPTGSVQGATAPTNRCGPVGPARNSDARASEFRAGPTGPQRFVGAVAPWTDPVGAMLGEAVEPIGGGLPGAYAGHMAGRAMRQMVGLPTSPPEQAPAEDLRAMMNQALYGQAGKWLLAKPSQFIGRSLARTVYKRIPFAHEPNALDRTPATLPGDLAIKERMPRGQGGEWKLEN